jgi:uncharacterized membrane protein YphA (DoxX/SURF4 family)
MEIVYLIGRIILGGFFLFNALNHLTRAGMMAGYAASKGVPLASLVVVATGLQLAVGGLMLLLGWYVWIAALVLVVFLVPVALVMHNFWAVTDPQLRMIELVQFTKNLALAGALLIIAAFHAATGWNPLAVGP